MISDVYAKAGRNAAPLSEYDYTQEYLLRLRGSPYIPVRRKTDFRPKPKIKTRSKYFTPLMVSINKSRPKGN